ncbi:MAG: amidohydrolase family protein [Lentisphaeria bacterium]|nr:amidohydrolase family protein [Lentisphaeria bacterium]
MFIDIHVHTRFTPVMPRKDGSNYASPDELEAFYKQAGIEKAVILPGSSGHKGQSMEELVHMSKTKYPWMIPFGNLDPVKVENNAYGEGIEDTVKYLKDIGCKGIGEVTTNIWFDDPFMLNLFAACETHQMPLIFHVSVRPGYSYGIADDQGLPRLELCLKLFKDLKFLGHSQAFWAEMGPITCPQDRLGYPKGKITEEGRLPQLMRKYPNLCGDLSAGSGSNALMRDREYAAKFLTEFQDRLYFGTDICATRNFEFAQNYCNFFIDMRDKGEISAEVFEKVARGNAIKLLRL